jgi:hypothetical protein
VLTSVLQFVTLVGFLLTGLRLYTSGLFLRYRIFFAYLIFSALHSAFFLTLNVRSSAYAWAWLLTEPLLWVFYVLIVLELYGLVLEKYQGLYTAGRWAMWISVAVAITLSSLSLLPKLGTTAYQRSRFLNYYYVIERGVVLSLLIFLFLILLILSRFPVRLSRNVVVHCVVYTAFFLCNSLGLFLRSLFGLAITRSLSEVLLGATAFCVLLWLIFLDEKGEAHHVSVANLGAEQEERILSALDLLNATLMRSARK